MSTFVMHADIREISRRAVVADFAMTLAEQPEFRRDAATVSAEMPPALAWSIHCRGWIVEPHGGDRALELGRRYGRGSRRSRVVAIFLREAAAALQFAPPSFDDPFDWAEVAMMNIGSVAYSA
ncbi:MAG: hypothetical protein M3134_11885, partial [Actinomycetota bacterium]|nr:hypothetical protein [Actinomycetota bacterium]